jgi:hypothetical protein
MRHDMAPVAGGVADGEQDRLVFARRFGERLWPPGPPIHRIVLVLEEIGTGFASEAVFVRRARGCCHQELFRNYLDQTHLGALIPCVAVRGTLSPTRLTLPELHFRPQLVAGEVRSTQSSFKTLLRFFITELFRRCLCHATSQITRDGFSSKIDFGTMARSRQSHRHDYH